MLNWVNLNEKQKEALKKQVEALNNKLASASAKSLVNEYKEVGEYKVLTKYVSGTSRSNLMALVDMLKQGVDNYIIALVGEENGNYPIVVACSQKAVKSGIMAGNLVREIANNLQGSGGGRPDMASGAGKNIDNIDSAFASVISKVK